MSVATIHPYTVGASSVPAILGLDPWDSAYALGARMLDGREHPASEAARMGLDLEAAHAELVAQAGYDVMPAPVAGFVHPELPWLHVHPDGLVALRAPDIVEGEPSAQRTAATSSGARSAIIGPLELKCRGVAPSEDLRMRDTVQSLVQVHAMGATQGLVSVLHGGFGGIRRDEWLVAHDRDLFGDIAERCEVFLSQLRRGVLPAPDGSDATRQAIRERFSHADAGSTVRATAEVWGWVKRIRALKETETAAKEQRQAFEHRVQDFMGDATELVSPLDTPAARWRPRDRTTLDTKALRAAHPGIAGEFSRTTTARYFDPNP
jgi:predicted phage-related endonuclease